jgi:hypothetical protein
MMSSQSIPKVYICAWCSTVFIPKNRNPHKYCSNACYLANPHRNRRRPVVERFWALVRKGAAPGDCWEWTGSRARFGYGRFNLRHYDQPSAKNGYAVQAHRLSWEFAHGPIPPGLWVLHRCDNPPCVRPDHLFLGTVGDNVRDAVAKGRLTYEWVAGRQPKAKLTPDQVRLIRALSESGTSRNELARLFGVTPGTVRLLVQRRTWKDVV